TRCLGTVEEADRGEGAVGNAVEEAPVKDLDAGKEIGGDLALAAPTRPSQRIEKIIAAALVADRRDGPLQQQGCVHLRRVEGGGEAKQGGVLAVEPEDVGVDDEKDIAEQRQGARHAAAG